MTNRLVSVGDDFNLPGAVNVLDANLPDNLQPAALNATFDPIGAATAAAAPKLDSAAAATTYAARSTAIPKWVTATAYTAGQQIITPQGDVVSAIANHTSGATFNPANWAYTRFSDYFVNVKSYGLVADGVADDTTAFQSIINAVRDLVRSTGMLTNNVVGIPAGRYKISTTLIVPTYVKLKSLGTVIIEWSGTNSTAIWITPVSTDPSPLYSGLGKEQWQLSEILAGQDGGFIIRNNQALGGTNVGLELGSRTNLSKPLSRYALTNVAIQGFDTGLQWNVYNHYLGTYNHFHIESNTTAISIGGGGALVNSGENTTFNNSIIAGATTGILVGSPSIDMNFNGCSFDFITNKLISTAYGYNRFYFRGGHIEAINDSLGATGGIINSTASAGDVNLHFDGVKLYIKSQPLFLGTNIRISGNVFDQAQASDANTVYPNSIRAVDGVRAVQFKSLQRDSRRIMSRNNNRIADPYWTKETPGAIATLNDWTWGSSGVTVTMVATTPNAVGNSLKLAIAAGGYITLTYKYDIPIKDADSLCQALAFQTDLVGTNASFQAILKDVAGASTTTAFVTVYNATTLAANVWNLPAYLTDIASADQGKAYTASTIRPVLLISNPTGSLMNVMVPFIYLGP